MIQKRNTKRLRVPTHLDSTGSKPGKLCMYMHRSTLVYIYIDIYTYTNVNPCIKCMECSVTQFGVSELCETLTGGFTR